METRHKPETTFGNVNADVIADKEPKFKPINFCSVIRNSPWADEQLNALCRKPRRSAINRSEMGNRAPSWCLGRIPRLPDCSENP